MNHSGSKQGYVNPYPQAGAPPAYAYQTAPIVATSYAVPATTYVVPTAVVVPTYRPFWNNLVITPITSSLRNFLLVSGILYLCWGITAIGLEVGIIIHSYSTFYRGFWMGAFIIGAAVAMLYAASQASYILLYLVRSLTMSLIFCIFGSIFSVVNYTASTRCDNYYYYYTCDPQIATNLKVSILALSIVATIHTIANLVVVSNHHKQSVMDAASGTPRRT